MDNYFYLLLSESSTVHLPLELVNLFVLESVVWSKYFGTISSPGKGGIRAAIWMFSETAVEWKLTKTPIQLKRKTFNGAKWMTVKNWGDDQEQGRRYNIDSHLALRRMTKHIFNSFFLFGKLLARPRCTRGNKPTWVLGPAVSMQGQHRLIMEN